MLNFWLPIYNKLHTVLIEPQTICTKPSIAMNSLELTFESTWQVGIVNDPSLLRSPSCNAETFWDGMSLKRKIHLLPTNLLESSLSGMICAPLLRTVTQLENVEGNESMSTEACVWRFWGKPASAIAIVESQTMKSDESQTIKSEWMSAEELVLIYLNASSWA